MDPTLLLPGAVYPSTKMVSVRYDDNGAGEVSKQAHDNAINEWNAWVLENNPKVAYFQYLDAILKVADMGLAVPEFALAGGRDIGTGVSAFRKYLEALKKKAALEASMQSTYERWVKATGQNVIPPAGLLDKERDAWDELQASLEALQKTAQDNLKGMPQPYHLLWEPEQFQPKPVERIVKTGFPLREASFVKRDGTTLGHFSLANLKNLDTRKLLNTAEFSAKGQASKLYADWKKDADKAGARLARTANSDGKASKDVTRNLFRQWLLAEGAICIPDQPKSGADWFDAYGLFDIEKFHGYLQQRNYKIKTLDDSGARSEWGKRLRGMIFKESVRSEFRLFDSSPQAQLVRCLTPTDRPIVNGSVAMKGPSFKLADGFKAPADVSLDIDLARGELELFKVDLPARHLAQELKIPYTNYLGKTVEMNFGRFSFHVGARAWGFAGASLMLSAGVSFDPGVSKLLSTSELAERDAQQAAQAAANPPPPGKANVSETDKSGRLTNANIGGYTVEQKDMAKASFNLFAGVQAGIELTGALNWAPPKGLVSIIATLPSTVKSEKDAQRVSEWLSLARLSLGASVAYGIGAEAKIGLSLENNRLILQMSAQLVVGPGAKGSFGFEVGYAAIRQLLELYSRELYMNDNRPLEWVTWDAEGRLGQLSTMAATGVNYALAYGMGGSIVLDFIEGLIRKGSGSGGPVAYGIMEYENVEELKRWIVEAPANGLGPLLYTLTFKPASFKVAGQVDAVSSTRCTQYQQEAMQRILTWIAEHGRQQGTIPQARSLFEEACMRMNKYGTRAEEPGDDYCQGRLRIKTLMGIAAVDSERHNIITARYESAVALLGARLDKFCSNSKLSVITETILDYHPLGKAIDSAVSIFEDRKNAFGSSVYDSANGPDLRIIVKE